MLTSGNAMKKQLLIFKNGSKQSKGINKEAILSISFFSRAFMWDTYSLVFSCKHYILERRLGALLEFYIYLPPVVWQAQLLCERLSVRGWSGGWSRKNVCHYSAKVVKRKPNLLQWYFFNHWCKCEFIPICQLKGTYSFSVSVKFFTCFKAHKTHFSYVVCCCSTSFQPI